jgi:four helix bundle protein
MAVNSFEDLDVWREAKRLSDAVWSVMARPTLARDNELRSQINGACLSTVANIAEGFARARRKEFAQFARVAAGSNAEVRALLRVATSRGHLGTEAPALIESTDRVGRMLRCLIESLERSERARPG